MNIHRQPSAPSHRRRALFSAGFLGLIGAGCTSATSPADSAALRLEQPAPAPGQSALRVARIAHYGDPVVVEVPESATAGSPLAVAVTTYGGGCVSEDTTVVQVDGLRADVVPYQRIYQPGVNGACTMELRVTRRMVSVVFASAGRATVRVIGRAKPGDSLVVVERGVLVR